MGIVNVTPDSFSDGGRFASPKKAIAHAARLAEEGADILDVGGESTRPGAAPVSLKEEMSRVLPVITELARRFPNIPLSIDTTKGGVARACLERGAVIVNDISALRFDPLMAPTVKSFGAKVVLMHMRGNPRTMQDAPVYKNVVEDLRVFFAERVAFAVKHGIRKAQIMLDPGLGFGKTVAHNLEILQNLAVFTKLGCPLVVGASRKSFIGKILSSETALLPPDERLEGSLAAALWAVWAGARVLRVHDVGATRKALKLWRALSQKPASPES